MTDFLAHVAVGEGLTRVGQLRFTPAGRRQYSTFSYDAAWIDNPRAFAVQPTFIWRGALPYIGAARTYA